MMELPSSQSVIESLYVHVPFCAQKCSYCAFYSHPAANDQIQRYVAALQREFHIIAPHCQLRTVFFGGGTPSLLSLAQWETILDCMGEHKLLGSSEFTIECNPATVSAEKARLLKSYGVNRISIGAQSFDDALLHRLGRVHTRQKVVQSYDVLRRAGFENINLDLMFAIPGQDLPSWRNTLDQALSLGCEHISSYEVIYEEDTAFFHQLQAGKVVQDEDLACDMYEMLVEKTERSGLVQYEVANFGKDAPHGRVSSTRGEELAGTPFYACRHNVNYWQGGAFEAIGPGASGYLGGVRFKHVADTRRWCELIEAGCRPIESTEHLAPLSRAGELAAFGLRMVRGWPLEEFRKLTGFNLQEHWAAEIQELVGKGWGELRPDCFRLTRTGLRFADSAAQLFLR